MGRPSEHVTSVLSTTGRTLERHLHFRIKVERAEDVIDRYAGSLPAGTYLRGYLDGLRDEWRA